MHRLSTSVVPGSASARRSALHLVARVILASLSSSLLAAQSKSVVELPTAPLRWGAGAKVAGKSPRVALLISADEYLTKTNWQVHTAAKSIAEVQSSLQRWAGVPEGAIHVLRGRDVNRLAVEAAVKQAFSALSPGESPLVLIYWMGHGAEVNKKLHLTTYYSERTADGLQKTIEERELELWATVASADAQDRLGATPQVVMLFDSCRDDLAPPAPFEVTAGTMSWKVYSTASGEIANAQTYDGVSPFCRGLTMALEELGKAREEVNIQKLAQTVSDNVRRLTGNQVPELVSPSGPAKETPPLIVKSITVNFGVRLVDAIDGTPVAGQLRIDDAAGQSVSGELAFSCATGARSVAATAEGYLQRRENLVVGSDHAGRALTVPMLRARTFVRGTVSNKAPGLRLRASASPSARYLETGYYRIETEVNKDGTYELLLPAATGVLVLMLDGKPLQDVKLATGGETLLADKAGLHQGTRSLNWPIRLDAAAQAALDAHAQAVADAARPARAESSPAESGSAKGKAATKPAAVAAAPATAPASPTDANLSALRSARESGDRVTALRVARELVKLHPTHPLGHLAMAEVLGSAADEAITSKSLTDASFKRFGDLYSGLAGDAAAQVGRDLRAAGFAGAGSALLSTVNDWRAQVAKGDWLMRLPDPNFLRITVRRHGDKVKEHQEQIVGAKQKIRHWEGVKASAEAVIAQTERPTPGRVNMQGARQKAISDRGTAVSSLSRLNNDVERWEKEIERHNGQIKKYSR
jgi:hypothetical protein